MDSFFLYELGPPEPGQDAFFSRTSSPCSVLHYGVESKSDVASRSSYKRRRWVQVPVAKKNLGTAMKPVHMTPFPLINKSSHQFGVDFFFGAPDTSVAVLLNQSFYVMVSFPESIYSEIAPS